MRRLACLPLIALLASTVFGQIDPAADHLADTELLELDEPLDVVMVRGINYFAERELADSPNRRPERWNRDYSSVEAYEASVAENRERLKTYIGAVDEFAEHPRTFSFNNLTFLNQMYGPGLDDALAMPLAWDVLEGVTCEGYIVTPEWADENGVLTIPVKTAVVVIPDADTSPEALIGLNNELPPSVQLARRLAANQCLVLVVAPINRDDTLSGHPDVRYTNLPHREFVYRMAFEMGRHVIGYEVQKVRAAIDVLLQFHEFLNADDDVNSSLEIADEIPIAVAGIGEGGLIALHAAAIDTRFDAAFVSGYFAPRENIWQEPIYRNVWRQLTEFGDAEIASLIAPRPLIIEAAAAPEIDGPPAPRDGRSNSAAPGRIETPALMDVQAEFTKAREHYARLGAEDHIDLMRSAQDLPGGNPALAEFLKELGIEEVRPAGNPNPKPIDATAEDAARQQRQFNELVRYTQRLMHSSDKERAKFWSNADRSSIDAWVESAEWYRSYVHEEMIGRLPAATMPMSPRTRKVIDEPTHVGYEVVLDCYPPGDEQRPIPAEFEEPRATDAIGWAVGEDWGIIAGGILLLPKDLEEGEQRPVVVCQHGLEGTPMHTIVSDPNADGWRAYKGFSTELVKRGFIVYAPQNCYRGRDQFRVIQRKSNPMGRSLYSYIIEQHRRTLDWLASLPYVDAERIGFYGLSYGGKTAVRVPPLLPPGQASGGREPTDSTSDGSSTRNQGADAPRSPGYCLSICSADFNEWVIKNVSSEDRYSYIFTGEYEMFEWNLGHVANYAELSSLMTPRPFMVERGHDDGVAPDEWVAWEYAKVRRHYDQLGIGELTEIEFFNGPHTINGQGTYDFLHRHLNWPAP